MPQSLLKTCGRKKPVGLSESQWLHLLAHGRTFEVLAQIVQLAQLFTAARPVQPCKKLGIWREWIFLCCCELPRPLPYSSTLKVCVRSGVLMVYSPTGASAARGKDRSTMPPTGVTFSHCAIRFLLGSCVGSHREWLFTSAKRDPSRIPVLPQHRLSAHSHPESPDLWHSYGAQVSPSLKTIGPFSLSHW